MCAELRKLSRRQVVVFRAVIALAFLLAPGLIGQRIPVVPRTVTTAAGLIAIVGGFFLIPSWLLYGLLREPGVRDGSVSWLAIRWRWHSAISGALLAVVGILLLLPGRHARGQSRGNRCIGVGRYVHLDRCACLSEEGSDASGAGKNDRRALGVGLIGA